LQLSKAELEANPNVPGIETARKFELAPSSLSCIKKHKESIRSAELGTGGGA
jgi:hypothetical protein